MKSFKVYFELYGKKMRTDIQAESEQEAKQKIRDAVFFHKVIRNVENADMPKFPDWFNEIFGKKL